MTRILIAVAVAFVFSVKSFAVVCGTGCTEMEGVCACEAQTEKVSTVTPSNIVSGDKVPTYKIPSYEREGIKAAMPSPLTAEDAKLDQEKSQADASGKKAAGLK
jgi:hypothetical protein